jgi:oligosaccharide repeat unit polymerase
MISVASLRHFLQKQRLVAALSALSVAGVVVTGAVVLLGGLPVAWLLLAVCAAATAPVLVWAVWEGRYFEPLPVIAAACFLLFVLRPLQLFTSATDLLSYYHSTDTLDRLLHVESQEVAAWVTFKLNAPLGPALTRAIGACALFLVLFLVGYCLGVGERAARWLSRRGRQMPQIDVRMAVGASLAIAVVAEAVVVARAGGPSEALKDAANQTAAGHGLVLNVLTGFAVAALMIWAAWRRPRNRLEWAGFAVCGLQLLVYSVMVGSRARIVLPLLMLAVVIHYCWRPWRFRELAAAFAILVVLASLSLAIREGAKNESLSDTLENAPSYALNFRAVLSDSNVFDHVLYATYLRPGTREYRYGGVLADAFRSYIPGFLDPSKPPGGDIVFRREVWGSEYKAGRPPTLVGDLYNDFGFPGIAVGALLTGIVARLLLGLLRDRAAPGRRYRVVLYALSLVLLYVFVTSTYSVALGYFLSFGLPLAVAIYGFGGGLQRSRRSSLALERIG